MNYFFGIFDSTKKTIVQNGLVLSLDAANAASYPGSGNIWYDLSGNNYNATLFNSPTFSSSNGGYLIFNGTNQYATGAFLYPSVNIFSFNIWVYNLRTTTSNTFIGTNGGSGGVAFIQIGGSPNPFQFNNSFNNTQASINTWTMLTAVQTPTSQQLYINAVAVTNVVSNLLANQLGTIFNIALRTDNPSNGYAQCYVGNAQIYNRTLSNAEILQNFNALKTRYGL
jgi:hypothetical protein